MCRFFMQRGKCWERGSMEGAVMAAPGRRESVSLREEVGVLKAVERCVRIGVRRSDSSRRGSAREVSCGLLVMRIDEY